jgi:hypothetical protein
VRLELSYASAGVLGFLDLTTIRESGLDSGGCPKGKAKGRIKNRQSLGHKRIRRRDQWTFFF